MDERTEADRRWHDAVAMIRLSRELLKAVPLMRKTGVQIEVYADPFGFFASIPMGAEPVGGSFELLTTLTVEHADGIVDDPSGFAMELLANKE
jgi:hypothetical protein